MITQGDKAGVEKRRRHRERGYCVCRVCGKYKKRADPVRFGLICAPCYSHRCREEYRRRRPGVEERRADREAGMCICRVCGERKPRAHKFHYGKICKECHTAAKVAYKQQQEAKCQH